MLKGEHVLKCDVLILVIDQKSQLLSDSSIFNETVLNYTTEKSTVMVILAGDTVSPLTPGINRDAVSLPSISYNSTGSQFTSITSWIDVIQLQRKADGFDDNKVFILTDFDYHLYNSLYQWLSNQENEYTIGYNKDTYIVLEDYSKNDYIAEKICTLGLKYYNGDGVRTDKEFAFTLFSISAKMGHGSAIFNMSLMCYEGDGVPKNLELSKLLCEEAVEYRDEYAIKMQKLYFNDSSKTYRRSVLSLLDSKCSDAISEKLCNLGITYYNGDGVDKDRYLSYVLFSVSAKMGYAPANYNLAVIYYVGEVVNKNLEESELFCKKAAEKGDIAAIEMMGLCFKNQVLTLDDGENDVNLIDDNEDLNSILELINVYEKEHNLKKVNELRLKAAGLGDAKSQFKVGIRIVSDIKFNEILETVDNTFNEVIDDGISWLLKSASKNYVPAKINLGDIYLAIGDVDNSLYWYYKSIKSYGEEAVKCFINTYEDHIDDIIRRKESFDMLLKIANREYGDAQYLVAFEYQRGRNVRRDIRKAKYWYGRSIENGNKEAQKALDNIKF